MNRPRVPNVVAPRNAVIGSTAVIVGGLLAACDAPSVVDPGFDNVAPVARLLVPQLVRTGEPVRLDASASDDDNIDEGDGDGVGDGDALSFVFSFGDGSPQATTDEGVFEHVFVAPGQVDVAVEVIDLAGESAVAIATITIVTGEVEACSCEAPCLPSDAASPDDAGVCIDALCHQQTSSDGAEQPTPDGALVCEDD